MVQRSKATEERGGGYHSAICRPHPAGEIIASPGFSNDPNHRPPGILKRKTPEAGPHHGAAQQCHGGEGGVTTRPLAVRTLAGT